ncbi:transcription elongation factor B polypeptide 3-like [Planococcus citri]|uniref:transcription elongation factor B polypeptide 3-like n=1 Tax=Planococcus citri TaxID=170843 RepID=UPI0031F9A089
MDSSSRNDLIKTIERYQNSIQLVNPPDRDAQRVLHYVRKLSKLPIKLEELEKTGVGKTINALRKCQGTVGDEASLLVGKWKAIAKKQVHEEELASRKRSDADSHSDNQSPGSEYSSNVVKSSKKIKSDDEKPIKESKPKSSKDKVQNGKDSSHDRKRKHSHDKDKHERKEKYVKVEPSSDYEDENGLDEPRVDKESSRKSIKVEDKHRDNDKKKKKEKPDENNVTKKEKEHDKKHKSSKHKDDKNHHRHHSSKSSHTEKKHDSKSDSEKYRERSDKKKDSSKSSHDSDKKSSKSSRKESHKSSSKYSSKEPSVSYVNNHDSDSDDYNGSPTNHTDDDFGAALLGIPLAVSPAKKRDTPSKYSSSIQSSPASPLNSGSDFDVLSNSVKLEPLDDLDLEKLKADTCITKDDIIRQRSNLRLKEISEEEALNSMTTTKNQRTKVFSGCKSRISVKFPTLFELCVRILQDNFDSLEFTGGVPFDVLKPILEKVTAEQLGRFEHYNPYLIGETDELWAYHVKKHFSRAKRLELESWRDVYMRCVDEREEKLQSLTENISQSMANSAPVRKTKLAYLDTHVKPPRNVARSQAKHGTANCSVKKSSPKSSLSPSAPGGQSVKERLAQESLNAPQAVTLASPRNQLVKKKKAPLMQKSLQLLKGLKR